MAEPDDDLWRALKDFRIGTANARLSFSARLAADNGWTHYHAEQVVIEYKRFLYLTMRAGHAVTPSDPVDQAWHLHLSYTRSYWDDLCAGILKQRLHHDPTEGGVEQQARFIDQYERTIDSYRRIFGHNPPANVWPSTGRRFSERFRRVNLTERWVIPRMAIPREWTFVLFWGSVGLALASNFLIGPSDVQALAGESTHPLTYFFAMVAVLVLLLPKTTNSTARRRSTAAGGPVGDSGCSADISSGDSGCGGGGCGGGGD